MKLFCLMILFHFYFSWLPALQMLIFYISFLESFCRLLNFDFFFPAVPDAQVGRLYRALILLGLALCLPSASMSNVFMVLYI